MNNLDIAIQPFLVSTESSHQHMLQPIFQVGQTSPLLWLHLTLPQLIPELFSTSFLLHFPAITQSPKKWLCFNKIRKLKAMSR